MSILGCKWHPSRDNIGVCALCLCESLSRLATYQDEDDESIDLEISPPSKPSRGLVASRKSQFILVRYDEDGNHGGMTGESSKSFYTGDGGSVMDSDNSSLPYDREPSYFSLDGMDHSDRQGEVSTSDDSGSGGRADTIPQSIPETGEPSHNKAKLHSSSGRRKPKLWGGAMLKMIGYRTLSVLWRSERKAEQASSSESKPAEQGDASNGNFGAPVHDQQLTPARFSVSSIMEQTTPARYSVSSQWELATPARYSVASINDQITPARYSGASLFDIESVDSKRFSTSSRGSPFSRTSVNAHKPINGDDFNAAWRASKSSVNARRMGAYEGSGNGFNELHPVGGTTHLTANFATGDYGREDGGQGREYVREAGQSKKSSWRWFLPFKGAPRKEERKESVPNFEKVKVEMPSDLGSEERRKSTSSIVRSKSRDRNQQTLTPKLSGKKSPWWRASPHIRAQKSPLTIPAKAENKDQEVAVSTDSDLMDDTPHRLSSASPLVGYSRSSSNGSSCFTTPRWNARQRLHHSNRVLGVQEIDREHEITHLAI